MKPGSSYPAGLVVLALPLLLALGACDVSDDAMVESRIPLDESRVADIRSAANDPGKAEAGAPMAAAPAPTPGTAPAPPAAAPPAPAAAPTAAGAPTAAPVVVAAAEPASGHDPAAGKALYTTYCGSCHGAGGGGDGPAAAALNPKPARHTDGSYMNGLSNDHLYKVVDKGGMAVGKSPLMTPWGSVLSEAQIWDVVAFMRTLAEPRYTGAMP